MSANNLFCDLQIFFFYISFIKCQICGNFIRKSFVEKYNYKNNTNLDSIIEIFQCIIEKIETIKCRSCGNLIDIPNFISNKIINILSIYKLNNIKYNVPNYAEKSSQNIENLKFYFDKLPLKIIDDTNYLSLKEINDNITNIKVPADSTIIDSGLIQITIAYGIRRVFRGQRYGLFVYNSDGSKKYINVNDVNIFTNTNINPANPPPKYIINMLELRKKTTIIV